MRHIFLLITLFCISGCTNASPVSGTRISIQMLKGAFEPSNISVQLGDTVCFENRDEEARWPASNIHPTHDIYPEFDPRTPVRPGETWCFIFTKAGIWKFHDHLLPELIGTITVGEESVR